MKKILMFTLILVLVVLSSLNCYAAIPQEGSSEASPLYVGTRSHNERFTISSRGQATMEAELAPLSTSTIDNVKVTFVIKNEDKVTIYNKSYDATWSNIEKAFNLTKYHDLELKGIYSLQVTYKCYKNDTLLETIKSNLIFKTY